MTIPTLPLAFASLARTAGALPADRPFLDVFQDPELASALVARMHPLFVHFPIALFLVAALAEILRPNRDKERPTATAYACVTLGALMGALAAFSGWTYAELYPPSPREVDTTNLHRWTGVVVAGLGLVAFVAGGLAHAKALSGLTRVYRAAIVLAGLGVGFSAHLGATLIHGEGYLTDVFMEPAAESAPSSAGGEPAAGIPADESPATIDPVPSTEPADEDTAPAEESPPAESSGAAESDEAGGGGAASRSSNVDEPIQLVRDDASEPTRPVSFEDDVLPIFVDRCIECHGPRKQKGDLRLDAEEYVFGGDPEFWVIERGDADASELQRRIELSPAHPDVMPARGDALEPEQIAVVRRWIDQGADFGGARLGSLEVRTPGATGTNEAREAEREGVEVPDDPGGSADSGEPADVEVSDPEARETALAALAEKGVWARPVAIGWNALDVDFRRNDALGDDALAELVPVADQVTSLDLTGSSVTDAGLAQLEGCEHLEFLVLRDTRIGDAALETLAALPALERLNLVGTNVTDAGAARLAEAPKLRRVYVWSSKVTPAGVEALRTERPELEVVWE